jgi:hypothetical protein
MQMLGRGSQRGSYNTEDKAKKGVPPRPIEKYLTSSCNLLMRIALYLHNLRIIPPEQVAWELSLAFCGSPLFTVFAKGGMPFACCSAFI